MEGENDRREEICDDCGKFCRAGGHVWCAALDDNRGTQHNCATARHGRWLARIAHPRTTCRQWLDAATCPICALDDPLADLPVHRPADWQNDPAFVARHVAAYRDIAGRHLPPPADLAGDGIVTFHAHADGAAWPGLVVAAKLLRASGCRLPLQIWTRGRPGTELDDDPYTALVDADYLLQRHRARHADMWAMKSYALAHSGFARALLLDWDAYCVADPAPLFELLDEYAFAYWSNVPWWDNADHHFMAPLAAPWAPVVQGGHYLIDCRRAWRELMLLRYWDDRADFFWHRCRSKDEAGLRVMLAACDTRYLHIGPADWEEVAFVCRWQGAGYVVHRCQGKIWPDHAPPSNPRLPREAEMLDILGRHFPLAARPAESEDARRARLRGERRRLLDAAR